MKDIIMLMVGMTVLLVIVLLVVDELGDNDDYT
jgi:hypothetical protein